ncbi:hypothetical protein GGI06_002376 [Coemansia sp. S85]|nr:hypothetical protein GGI06_002376 [Coemansia sp. S85]
MAAPYHVLFVLAAIVFYRLYFYIPPSYNSPLPFMSSPLKPIKPLSIFLPPSEAAARKPRNLKPTLYVPDYVNLDSVQRCLEDRRSSFVTVNSTEFSSEAESKSRPHKLFYVLERVYFALFSHGHPPVKFSYKSRNAIMALSWRTTMFTEMSSTKFLDVDGLWQLEQLPVLCFVFGRDADTLRSSYLIDDNTIHEYYDSAATVDMAELATVAREKAGLCVSHFFVVNRGKEYWAVDTKDPGIGYAFGPSIKTRTITRLTEGSMTVQVLIDEDQSGTSVDGHGSQSLKFTLRDVNGEEVNGGDRFVLRIPGDRGDDNSDVEDNEYPEDLDERHTIFDGKDWVTTYNASYHHADKAEIVVGTMDYASYFEMAIIDGITYLTVEGLFIQIENWDGCPCITALPKIPHKHNRICLTSTDDGFVTLSRWDTRAPITLEWVKAACGVFSIEDNGYNSGAEYSTRLCLIKV